MPVEDRAKKAAAILQTLRIKIHQGDEETIQIVEALEASLSINSPQFAALAKIQEMKDAVARGDQQVIDALINK